MMNIPSYDLDPWNFCKARRKLGGDKLKKWDEDLFPEFLTSTLIGGRPTATYGMGIILNIS